MIRLLTSCSAPLLLALLAGPAHAEPIFYSTRAEASGGGGDYTGSPLVRFEGTEGTFEPGSTISLGRFVIEPHDRDSTPSQIDGKSFYLGLRTPQFDQAAPQPPWGYTGPSYSGLVIRGHFELTAGSFPDSEPNIVAVFDSATIGYAGPVPAVTHLPPTFPVALADVKLPATRLLMSSADLWVDGNPHYSGEVMVQITPEPATLAAWGLVGLGAIAARRRARASNG